MRRKMTRSMKRAVRLDGQGRAAISEGGGGARLRSWLRWLFRSSSGDGIGGRNGLLVSGKGKLQHAADVSAYAAERAPSRR